MIRKRSLGKEITLAATLALVIGIGLMIVCPLHLTASAAESEEVILHADSKGTIMSLTDMINAYRVSGDVSSIKLEVASTVPTDEEIVNDHMGDSEIITSNNTLVKMSLPSAYYDIDFSSFQAWMPYSSITTKGSDSYKFLHSSGIYYDENGLYRHQVDGNEEFTINNLDDYVVALATFYKTPHKCGERFLVVTTTGMFTITTGDEQANRDTDSHNMFIQHGNKASLIEYIVDTKNLHKSIKNSGSVTSGPVSAIKGKITAIYKITK